MNPLATRNSLPNLRHLLAALEVQRLGNAHPLHRQIEGSARDVLVSVIDAMEAIDGRQGRGRYARSVR